MELIHKIKLPSEIIKYIISEHDIFYKNGKYKTNKNFEEQTNKFKILYKDIQNKRNFQKCDKYSLIEYIFHINNHKKIRIVYVLYDTDNNSIYCVYEVLLIHSSGIQCLKETIYKEI